MRVAAAVGFDSVCTCESSAFAKHTAQEAAALAAGITRRKHLEAELEARRKPTTFTIRGVPCKFPFEPYAQQKVYMERVIEALQTGRHALLESPTGTGKTLSLLCASLAWLEAVGGAPSPPPGRATTSPPRIIYASRTHTQLSQVIKELKACGFTPRLTVLGSREQLCVNATVSQLDGMALAHECRRHVSARTCRHYIGVDEFVRSGGTPSNLQGYAREASRPPPAPVEPKPGSRALPSHFVRVPTAPAPPTETPFTASGGTGAGGLGDGAVRRMVTGPAAGVAAPGVLDIEELAALGKSAGVCPYYLTRETSVLAQAELIIMPYNYIVDPTARQGLTVPWENATLIFDEAHNLESVCDDASSFDISAVDLGNAFREMERVQKAAENSLLEPDFDPNNLNATLRMVDSMVTSLNTLVGEAKPGTPGYVRPGGHLYAFLGSVGLNGANYEDIMALLESASAFLVAELSSTSTTTFSLRGIPVFVKMIKRAFEGAMRPERGLADMKDYSFVVHAIETGPQKGQPVLSMWCFRPGVAMREVSELDVRCMLLTSGTLSPMESFAMEYNMSFPVTVENMHVIKRDQVSVQVVPVGPTGQRLNSSYDNRNRPEYKTELGLCVVNMSRLLLSGGMLVFFPSYGVMASCVTHWKEAKGGDIWKRMEANGTVVLVEQRGSAGFTNVVDNYRRSVTLGARTLLLAVCRGKVSEGLDFADDMGRLVLVTGIPFPPKNDARVVLKQQYLDKARRGITGRQWYTQQAVRAVNQAVGRVIRHLGDYGAILLCDERFASHQNNLSRWLRPCFTVAPSYGHASGALSHFLRANGRRCSIAAEFRRQQAAVRDVPSPAPDAAAPAAAHDGRSGATDGAKDGDGGAPVAVSKPSALLLAAQRAPRPRAPGLPTLMDIMDQRLGVQRPAELPRRARVTPAGKRSIALLQPDEELSPRVELETSPPPRLKPKSTVEVVPAAGTFLRASLPRKAVDGGMGAEAAPDEPGFLRAGATSAAVEEPPPYAGFLRKAGVAKPAKGPSKAPPSAGFLRTTKPADEPPPGGFLRASAAGKASGGFLRNAPRPAVAPSKPPSSGFLRTAPPAPPSGFLRTKQTVLQAPPPAPSEPLAAPPSWPEAPVAAAPKPAPPPPQAASKDATKAFKAALKSVLGPRMADLQSHLLSLRKLADDTSASAAGTRRETVMRVGALLPPDVRPMRSLLLQLPSFVHSISSLVKEYVAAHDTDDLPAFMKGESAALVKKAKRKKEKGNGKPRKAKKGRLDKV